LPYLKCTLDYLDMNSVVETAERHALTIFLNESKYKGDEMGVFDIVSFNQDVVPSIPADRVNEVLNQYYNSHYSKLQELRLEKAAKELEIQSKKLRLRFLSVTSGVFLFVVILLFISLFLSNYAIKVTAE